MNPLLEILSNVPLQVKGKTISKYDFFPGMPYLSESNPDISCKDKTISWRTDCQCGNEDKKDRDKSKLPLRSPNINAIPNAEINKLKQRTVKRNLNNAGSCRLKSSTKLIIINRMQSIRNLSLS